MENDRQKLVFDIKQDPYNYAMRTVFTRWKPFILHAMDWDEGTHFSRFCRQMPITQKVLTENLRQLEEDGFVTRTVVPTSPPQVTYSLTEAGKEVIPLLDAVYEWAWKQMKEKGLPIDALGEMWHGFRERDPDLMEAPYKTTHHK